MKWFGRFALAVFAVVAPLLVVGMMLPSGFKVQRSVEMAASADKVYPLIKAPREWKKWSVWNRRPLDGDAVLWPAEGGLTNLKGLVES